MARESTGGTGRRPRSVPTPDELVVHLREAGARSVYLAGEAAFRDGTIPITATYEYAGDDPGGGSASEVFHQRLRNVFDAIGDRIWFHDREWLLEGTVEPAFTDPPPDLVPLYDRSVERNHGDGFNLRNLLFVYEDDRD